MSTLRFNALLFVLLAASGASADAGVMSLTLQPSRDLTTLQVGDSFTIEVVLDKMNIGDLDFMGATVDWTPGLLSAPSNVVAGAIIADPMDFFPLSFTSSVDGQFASVGSAISTNGTFYSFELTAASPGTGTIAFDPITLFAQDTAGSPYFESDIDTNSLRFTVTATNVVPEPGTIACFAMLGAVGLSGRIRRRSHLKLHS